MKKTGMMWGLCVAMGLSAVSFAGIKGSNQVSVDPVGRAFNGTMGAVRNSPDNRQSLYCLTYSSGVGVCVATDAAGVTVSCSTSDPAQIAAIRSLNSDGFLTVTYNASGVCTTIVAGVGSAYDPKQP
ncbi:hypothetical protein [Corallococcus sp. M7]